MDDDVSLSYEPLIAGQQLVPRPLRESWIESWDGVETSTVHDYPYFRRLGQIPESVRYGNLRYHRGHRINVRLARQILQSDCMDWRREPECQLVVTFALCKIGD